MSRSFDQFWMRRAKTLTQALIISGTINIGLIGTFVYFVLKDKNAAISVEVKLVPKDPVAHVTNEQILRSYSSLTFQDLLLKLENKDLIEEGFAQRDLALACLVTFHHFNIDQALGGMVPQKRSIFFRNQDATESVDVIVYPGLLDDQFEGILSYAKTEKWPFTSKGLFFEVKRSSPVVDASLLDAFYTTAEFFSVYTFLHKVGLPVEKTLAAALLAEGDWEPVAEFCEQQRLTQDFSDEKRRTFLLSCFEKGRSKIASSLLAAQDLDFVLKRLDDTSILSYLELIEDKKNVVERAAKELLVSPRGDEVRKRAAEILYSLSGEPSEHYEYLSAVKRFCPEFLPKPVAQADKALSQSKAALTAVASETKKGVEIVSASNKKRVHVIQDGDSLWKISRKYKVSIEEIKKINQLETEKLRVGKSLQIPDSKS
jgi:hypothetical protein